MQVTNYTYQHVTGAATTIVQNGPCTLHSITTNSAGTLCTVYDNNAASGNVIAVINTASSVGNSLIFDARCSKGITVVTTGASTDLTITFGATN